MEIKIEDYNIETDLDDIVQAFYDIDKDEVLESLDEDGTYYGDYFELTKDEKNENFFCELYIDNNVLDCVNSLKALKNDQFILITRYYDYNIETDYEYSTIDGSGAEDQEALLVGGIYDYKSIATEEEKSKYNEDRENDLIESDAKYQDHYLIRLKDFNFKKWLDKWLSDDDKMIDELQKNNPIEGRSNPRNLELSGKNISSENGLNIIYTNEFLYTKFNKKNNIINGVKETYLNDILIKSEEYKDGKISGLVKTFDKESGVILGKAFISDDKKKEFSIDYWNNNSEGYEYILDGSWQKLNYYSNNNTIHIRFSVNGGGNSFHPYYIGPVICYEVRNGNKIIGIAYSFDNEGNFLFIRKFIDGKRIDLNEDEEKKLIDSIKIFECHYRNGNLMESRGMKEGKVHGVWKRFYPNGKLRYVTNHINGEMNGKEQIFYENGQLMLEIERIDGLQSDGEVNVFYKNGNLKRSVSIVDSEYHGEVKEWDIDGNLKLLQKWENGKMISENNRNI